MFLGLFRDRPITTSYARIPFFRLISFRTTRKALVFAARQRREIGGFLKKFDGFAIVLRHALPFVIHPAEIGFCVCIALRGSPLKKLDGFRVVIVTRFHVKPLNAAFLHVKPAEKLAVLIEFRQDASVWHVEGLARWRLSPEVRSRFQFGIGRDFPRNLAGAWNYVHNCGPTFLRRAGLNSTKSSAPLLNLSVRC